MRASVRRLSIKPLDIRTRASEAIHTVKFTLPSNFPEEILASIIEGFESRVTMLKSG